jgi:hypothetical protein
MNLEPQRPRSPQPRGAPDALKRDERPGVKRETDRMRDAERFERRSSDLRDDPGRVAIERVGRAVRRLRCRVEEIEVGRAARPDDQRAAGPGQELIEAQRRRRRVEGRGRKRQENVQAERAQRRRQRRERLGRRNPDRREALAYFSWKGYGVVRPSEGGKAADLTAFSTQAPVGVPANLPVTVADVTLPLLPMTTVTIAIPWTLNSL